MHGDRPCAVSRDEGRVDNALTIWTPVPGTAVLHYGGLWGAGEGHPEETRVGRIRDFGRAYELRLVRRDRPQIADSLWVIDVGDVSDHELVAAAQSDQSEPGGGSRGECR